MCGGGGVFGAVWKSWCGWVLVAVVVYNGEASLGMLFGQRPRESGYQNLVWVGVLLMFGAAQCCRGRCRDLQHGRGLWACRRMQEGKNKLTLQGHLR